jgi:glycopeptide antibiotics resistance protein
MAKVHRERLVLRMLWLLGCVLMAVGSLLPAESVPVLFFLAYVSDKVLHLSAYTLLALLPVLRESRRVAVLSVAAVFWLGLFLEVAQSLVGSRSPELADIAANGSGVALGALLGVVLRAAPARRAA